MVSSFASQLQAIANNSSNELDLKARRNAHAESLIFEKEIAVKQDFETIYNVCIQGFRELCQLDSRFHDFDRNLFAEQAKAQDREELTASQNEALDLVLKRCLMLLGGKVLLKPALQALEWLVRRFRVHIYNVNDLLHTLLPYHEVSIWANTLSIIPATKVVGQWKFVRPYLKTTWTVPRHAVAYAASNNDAFFTSLNSYALNLCRQGFDSTIYTRFWSGIVVEAISARLNQTRSGRQEVQNQRLEDFLLQVLPVLNEGFEISTSSDLTTTCYTITIILAAKAELGDQVLDSLLFEVCQSLQRDSQNPSSALITACVIAEHKQDLLLPKKVVTVLSSLTQFETTLRDVSETRSCQRLLYALIYSTLSYMKRKSARQSAEFASKLVHLTFEICPDALIETAIVPLVSRALELVHAQDTMVVVRNELVTIIQSLAKVPEYATAISHAVVTAKLDGDLLETLLGMTVELPVSESLKEDVDVLMQDAPVALEDSLESFTKSIPSSLGQQSSFFAGRSSEVFLQLAGMFELYANDSEKLSTIANLPLWKSASNKSLSWQTFLLRFACSTYHSSTRQKALRLFSDDLEIRQGCDIQMFIPYLLMLLTDVKSIRRTASNLLNQIQTLASKKSQDSTLVDFYGADNAQHVVLLTQKQITSLLVDVICPVLEECVLDQTHIVKEAQGNLQPNTTADAKKSHRQALFSILTQHALATPLIRLKVMSISMLDRVQKIGGKSKTKLLVPILQDWSNSSLETVESAARESGLGIEEIDKAFVRLTDVNDGQYLDQITRAAESSDLAVRPGLLRALFNYIRQDWKSWKADEQLSIGGTLFNLAFAPNSNLASGVQDVLRTVELSSEVLATILQLSEVGSSDVRGPPSKKKRRSSSGASQSRVEVMKSIDTTTAKISLALELVDNNNPEAKPELLTVMFEMLASLKQLQQNRVESPYLLNLCLSSIYVMVQPLGSRGMSTDLSGIKPELVTDCLRSSENPQVQNASLLVMAALSTVVPDRMVHNVMPIFTFIGQNMLSKDDEHSINVVNEAIDKIVPALLQSLRKAKNAQTYETSMSTMLASFTSAHQHIPRHRRVAFYQKLLFAINIRECGFILIALLAAQEGKADSFTRFLEDLVSPMPPVDQFVVYDALTMTSVDVLSSSPVTSTAVYNLSKGTSTKERVFYAISNLKAANIILQNSKLASALRTPSRLDSSGTEHIREQLRRSFKGTLTAIRDLKSASENVVTLAKQNLDALLQLPKPADLLEMLADALDSMEETQLRPQALRVLALQLQGIHKKDSRARASAFELMPKLNTYVRPSDNTALVQASLSCLNCIAEVYGRREPEVIITAAENVIEHGLAAFKSYPKVLEAALLTIASVVEATKEGFLPLVSQTVTQILSVVRDSAADTVSATLFRAACSLLSAIVSHASFILSQEQVTQILDTMISAQHSIDVSQDEADFPLLIRSIAQKVELDLTIAASTAIIESKMDSRESTATILLQMLGQAIEASSKTAVIRQAEAVSRLFTGILRVRIACMPGSDSEDTSAALLDQLKAVSIKFIYKINDTTFRPIFESWVDWTTSTDGVDQALRRTTLFEILTHFFETLKSIVTSYSTYLLTPLSSILNLANSPNISARPSDTLLTTTLTLLRTMTTHDADAFFSAPSHFDPIAEPLITTLNLASTKSKRPLVQSHVIPAIIGLATATVDSPSTHSTLVHHLVGLKSHNSAHVRLASIRTLLALTEDEDVGDDFVANVIGIGGGEGEGARGGGSSVGEVMVYVNEMLEDDDEEVELGVRKWVQVVREKVGEDVFEV